MRQFKRNILRTSDNSLLCGQGLILTGGSEGYYEIPIFVGSGTGNITLTLQASNIPDRFQIVWDDNIVADSLFIGGYLGGIEPPNPNPSSDYEDTITTPNTNLPKFLYNGITHVPNGTIAVDFDSSDIADSTGNPGTLRSLGGIGGQIGVVANYPIKIAQTVQVDAVGIDLEITVGTNTYITPYAVSTAQTASNFLQDHATSIFNPNNAGILLTNPAPSILTFTESVLKIEGAAISAPNQIVNPIDYTNVAKASDGAVKLTFTKSAPFPQEIILRAIGMGQTGWSVLDIECS